MIGVEREKAAVRNATMCKPHAKTREGALRIAVECCRPRLRQELANDISASPARHLVLVCGGKALQSVSGETVIDDWRGYPVEWKYGGTSPVENAVFFPTYHPAFVMRRPQYLHVFRRDLRVAWDYAHGRTAPMEWPRLYLDNATDAEAFLFSICERLEAGHNLDIGVDVETAGDWNTRLLLLGIATEEGSASLLYPFATEHLAAYAKYILAHPNATLVVQNGNHDALSLERHKFKLSPKRWDTIVAGRVAYPDLPHDLGFMATLFFFVDRWKSVFHSGSSQDKKGDESWEKYMQERYLQDFLTYNAKDALSQILMKYPLERRLAHVPK